MFFTLSSPPWLRQWNGVITHMKQVLKRDARMEDLTIGRRTDGGSTTAEASVQFGGTYVLRHAAMEHLAEDDDAHLKWTDIDPDSGFESREAQLRVAMGQL